MIYWLASYPRSGRTLFRLFLKQIFGYESYSEGNYASHIGSNRDVAKIVGHKNYETNWPDFLEEISRSKKKFFVVTHEYPSDGFPAIYIHRDGRAVIVSYFHYLTEMLGDKEVTMDQVIMRNVPFGHWSEHSIRWDVIRCPNTLLVRYEDIINDPHAVISTVSRFIDEDPVKTNFVNQFATLNEKMPKFFRTGSNESNFAELTKKELELFWSEHAEQMVKLGLVATAEVAGRILK